MHVSRSLAWLALIGLLASSPVLKASLNTQRIWKLSEIADAPVLLVGRVVSLDRQLGPHFTGNPKSSASEQTMTAEVEVLRFSQRAMPGDAVPPQRLKIRFIGVDGPVFFMPKELPSLEPGQVLLLPLRSKSNESSEPWELIGAEGYGMTMRVAASMQEPALASDDPRDFIIREVVNSFGHGDPIAINTAASLVMRQADYLEPELTSQLQNSIGSNAAQWAQVLGNLLLSFPNVSLTINDIQAGKTVPDETMIGVAPVTKLAMEMAARRAARFQGGPLAQVALSHLPGNAAETMVWRALLSDLPGLADEPYHPLFAYNSSQPMGQAVHYLSRYRNDPAFIEAVSIALRGDQPGSSALASNLVYEGQRACLPEALDRALKVIHRPTDSDVFAGIRLIVAEGSEQQRRQYLAVVQEFKATNPDYAAFLMMQFGLNKRR
jgi:hypothetical protein